MYTCHVFTFNPGYINVPLGVVTSSYLNALGTLVPGNLGIQAYR
jgi:hypothetical protein